MKSDYAMVMLKHKDIQPLQSARARVTNCYLYIQEVEGKMLEETIRFRRKDWKPRNTDCSVWSIISVGPLEAVEESQTTKHPWRKTTLR